MISIEVTFSLRSNELVYIINIRFSFIFFILFLCVHTRGMGEIRTSNLCFIRHVLSRLSYLLGINVRYLELLIFYSLFRERARERDIILGNV
jgi:hypothetical protein